MADHSDPPRTHDPSDGHGTAPVRASLALSSCGCGPGCGCGCQSGGPCSCGGCCG